VGSLQRLFTGVLVGTLLALLIHPAARETLFYLLRSHSAVAAAVERSPLSQSPSFPIRPPRTRQVSTMELSFLAYQMARRINVRGQAFVEEQDFRQALAYLQSAAVAEPDNAFWPQMVAVLAHRSGRPELAQEMWRRAAVLGTWSDRRGEQILALSEQLAEADGQAFAWHTVLATRLRLSDPVAVILRSAAASFEPTPEDPRRLRERAIAIANAGLILRGAYSVEARMAACTLAYRAAEMGAGPRSSVLEPSRFEDVRSSFVRAVAEEVSEAEAQAAARTLMSAEGWLRLIKPMAQVEAERNRVEGTAVLTAVGPSALLLSALCLAGLALLGWCVRLLLGAVPHPDPRAVLGVGAILALVVYVGTGFLSLAAWVAVLSVVVALPVEVASTDPASPRRSERVILLMIGVVGAALLTWFFIHASAPSRLLATFDPDTPPWTDESRTLLTVALVTLSLIIPASRIFAGRRRMAVFSVLGSYLAWTAAALAAMAVTLAAVATPVALKVERDTRRVVQMWATDEQKVFRIDYNP
jgi:tetratricopeptide (TPR) repeat protein